VGAHHQDHFGALSAGIEDLSSHRSQFRRGNRFRSERKDLVRSEVMSALSQRLESKLGSVE
jgi:hypothetical protein